MHHTHTDYGEYLGCCRSSCHYRYRDPKPNVKGHMLVFHDGHITYFHEVTQASYRLFRDRVFTSNPDAFVFFEGVDYVGNVMMLTVRPESVDSIKFEQD